MAQKSAGFGDRVLSMGFIIGFATFGMAVVGLLLAPVIGTVIALMQLLNQSAAAAGHSFIVTLINNTLMAAMYGPLIGLVVGVVVGVVMAAVYTVRPDYLNRFRSHNL